MSKGKSFQSNQKLESIKEMQDDCWSVNLSDMQRCRHAMHCLSSLFMKNSGIIEASPPTLPKSAQLQLQLQLLSSSVILFYFGRTREAGEEKRN